LIPLTEEEDKCFFHSKEDNFVIMKFIIEIKPDFNADSSEIIFGFLFRTETLRDY